MSEAIVITGTNIMRYRLKAIQMGLELQVKTGLKSTNNRVPNAARAELLGAGIQPKRTVKALALQFKEFAERKLAEMT